MIHKELTKVSASIRIAARLNSAATPATAIAQRIAVFHSTCLGLASGSAPVVPAAASSAPTAPPASTDWFSSARLSCGAPHWGQKGDSPLLSGNSPPQRWQNSCIHTKLSHPTPLRKQAQRAAPRRPAGKAVWALPLHQNALAHGQRFGLCGQIAVDGRGCLAPLRNRPYHQRLASTHVARCEDALH